MILDEIAAHTRLRVARDREAVPPALIQDRALAALENRAAEAGTAGSFEAAIAGPGLSFICEVKKASPSKGVIAERFPYMRIAQEYEAAGAAAISVLTEPEYFLGSVRCLREIAAAVRVPVLRKDFIVDSYQIYESVLLKAGAVLLICALLGPGLLEEYVCLAAGLDLAALVEVHTPEEARMALDAGARIIGINNRDLRTFQVDLGTTGRIRRHIPPGTLVVAESGVQSGEDLRVLREYAIDGVLIGESLMKAADKKRYLEELRGSAHA
ncbi:MAG: indole-3-glycerol phosphate synthase TrpC [Treponema sp.]|nr:indole-3-glycerol phosphate synthase TrpC [Treponema sp.]